MLKTSNPQINHLIEQIDEAPMPHIGLALIAMLVEECNHKDKLIDSLTSQIPG